jgi:RecA-family ATPase
MALVLHSLVDPPPAPARWLVPELIPIGGLTVLYGAPGSGKSALALLLGVACATGRHWLGLPVASGAVIFAAIERGSVSDIRRRRLTRSQGAPC